MSEEQEQQETVDIKGHAVPKDAYQAIVNSVQSSLNNQHKNELAKIIGEQDAENMSLGQAIHSLRDKISSLEEATRAKPKTEEGKVDKLELERQKLQAEFEKKQRDYEQGWKKREQVETIKAHAIKNGLTPEFTDIFGSLLETHFNLEINEKGVLYKDKRTEQVVFNSQAEPAGPEQIADLLKTKFPGAFTSVKTGLGAKANGSTPSKDDWDKMSVRDLLRSH